MAIEVTSIPQSRLSLRKLADSISSFFHDDPLSNRRLMFRSACGLFTLALIIGGDSLLSSYKYYSRIIDARLASGYLTSRPGLYAAPRTLRVGQKLSRADLMVDLRRAGYVKSEGSNVWSGSFRETEGTIEIRPNANQTGSTIVKIGFNGDQKISELTDDGISINAFTLEPEVLSNDPLSKAGKREAVRFSENTACYGPRNSLNRRPSLLSAPRRGSFWYRSRAVA